ncbi:MAG: 5-guanidino-2-oxopentanoate decarboxylase [Pseudomonadota bacterium]|jgi:acetolactate synthase-1/2/3 large subunit
MKKTLGTYLIEALEAQGVRHVFGIPGVHNLELYRGLAASSIRHIAGRHEQGLGFMADGYARACGGVGVCFTITGPGLTNIASAMAQAMQDSIPLLVISSENRRGEMGTGQGFLHEIPDQMGIAQRVSRHAERILTPEDLPPALERAFRNRVTGRPGPTYLEIPRDVLTEEASHLALPSRSPAVPPVPAPALIAAAALRLAAAKSPVILVGGGAVAALAQVRRVAECLDAPVVMTVNARGLLPPGHPLAVPMSPSLAPVRALVAAADVVLAIGTEFGQTDYDMYALSEFAQPPGLIRIDIDHDQMRRSVRADSPLVGDAAATLDALLAAGLGNNRDAQGATRALEARAGALAALSPAYVREIELLNLIRDTVPGVTIVGDSTQAVYAGNLGYAAATPGTWFNSATGYGTLGYALPASTGAGLARPDLPIVCLVGDGGLQFTLGEMAGPRDVGAWTAIIVWNNYGYGEIKTSMIAVDIEPEGVDIQPPDFSLLAAAYGYAHRRVDDVRSLEAALREFGSRRQVVVIEVRAEAFE